MEQTIKNLAFYNATRPLNRVGTTMNTYEVLANKIFEIRSVRDNPDTKPDVILMDPRLFGELLKYDRWRSMESGQIDTFQGIPIEQGNTSTLHYRAIQLARQGKWALLWDIEFFHENFESIRYIPPNKDY